MSDFSDSTITRSDKVEMIPSIVVFNTISTLFSILEGKLGNRGVKE